MSMTPVPGWYPDPTAPGAERWWDGTVWTEHRRTPPPQPAGAVPGAFGPPPTVVHHPPAPGGRPGRGRTVALLVAAVVVVAAAVGATLLTGGGDTPHHAPAPSAATTGSDDRPSPSPPDTASPSPSGDPSVVVDDLDGITLPILDGWTRAEYAVDDDMMLSTPGTYDCPGDDGLCRGGAVYSHPSTSSDAATPKEAAAADVSAAADHSFDRNSVGDRPYGGITGHQQVKEGAVAVAGRSGYLVRWRVTTAKGPAHYVESLAFPSTVGSESMVVVRFAFDSGAGAPPLADMDRITQGIRSVDGSGGDGGVGSGVGPTR